MSKHTSVMLSIMMFVLLGCATTVEHQGIPNAEQLRITQLAASDRDYHHLVILGDPHLPGKNIKGKEEVIRKINFWGDVDMVVAVGDICEDLGTDREYAEARRFFDKLNKPLFAIVGNHDFFYEDVSHSGTRVRAGLSLNEAKLNRFMRTFALPAIYYDKIVGSYLLVFLSADRSGYLSQISEQQLEWLRVTLGANNKIPTIVFFHAPLAGTLRNYNRIVNTSDFIAQPSGKIDQILKKNPQVFMWVSGHTHTSPNEESFASSLNLYRNRITNIHNTDMNRKRIWTNSLLLYPDRVIVRTYDHQDGAWVSKLERTILPPKLMGAHSSDGNPMIFGSKEKADPQIHQLRKGDDVHG